MVCANRPGSAHAGVPKVTLLGEEGDSRAGAASSSHRCRDRVDMGMAASYYWCGGRSHCLADALLLRTHGPGGDLSLIHISEPTRRTPISYAVFCLKKK